MPPWLEQQQAPASCVLYSHATAIYGWHKGGGGEEVGRQGGSGGGTRTRCSLSWKLLLLYLSLSYSLHSCRSLPLLSLSLKLSFSLSEAFFSLSPAALVGQ
ncbi:hypothetical protein ABZP36_033026 [Zizania latifolia]